MKPTQEQVIAWARETRMSVKEPSWGYSDEYSFAGFEKTFMRFAILAYEAGRKDENEACAELVVQCSWNVKGAENALLVDGCAAAIRARREQ